MTHTNWVDWQQQVFSQIRTDYAEVLHNLSFDEVDWAAWRELYDQGRSAIDAVDYAFVREPSGSVEVAPTSVTAIDNPVPVAKTVARSGH